MHVPHLQIDINKVLRDEIKIELVTRFKALFAEVMETETDHIATVIREHGTYNLDIGRAEDRAQGVAHVNADIRAGRTLEQRRALALGFMDILHHLAGIPAKHFYVTFTQHPGEDFHLHERYLSAWQPGEDPLA
jgi:5-carboxymethyl-2-hydroxymuconate isomerase